MADLFTIENLLTLVVLTALETVLGFDNLLYISIEAKRVAPDKQKYVRRVGTSWPSDFASCCCLLSCNSLHLFQNPFFGFQTSFIAGSLQWPQPDCYGGRRVSYPHGAEGNFPHAGGYRSRT